MNPLTLLGARSLRYGKTVDNVLSIDALFEALASRVGKGEKGQFFTPRHVVDFVIDALRPELEGPALKKLIAPAIDPLEVDGPVILIGPLKKMDRVKQKAEADTRSEVLIFLTPKITNKASLRCEGRSGG